MCHRIASIEIDVFGIVYDYLQAINIRDNCKDCQLICLINIRRFRWFFSLTKQ